MTDVLTAEGLVRRIGPREVVAGVHFTLEAGESVSLVGPSGCGKTTLLQMLGLLDRPDDGAVRFGAVDPWSLPDAARARLRLERIGFVFQQNNLLEALSARDNVALPAWRRTGRRADARRRASELLERLGLSAVADARGSELSGGEAQRVAIARAIVNEPALVLADEPTGSLDSASARAVMATLLAACERGAAVFVVTHDSDVAARTSRSVGMLDGRIVRMSHLPPPSGGARA
ncbi:MAG TPA: ABC transporter ATP-binding protein [Labilithrix sp.]|jgi:putative ABC transport system ATP-binding protein